MAAKISIEAMVQAAEQDPEKPLVPARYHAEGAEYVNARTKVPIRCTEHGTFWILPRDIERRSYLCTECRDELKGQQASEEGKQFAAKIRKKFGDEAFDLSKLNYVNTQTPVSLVCNKHGTRHKIYPFDLDKLKYGCTDCRNDALREKYTAPPEVFLEKAKATHGIRYSYDNVDYQGSHKKIVITCKEHGEFQQTPASHLRGRGCPLCGKAQTIEKKKISRQANNR